MAPNVPGLRVKRRRSRARRREIAIDRITGELSADIVAEGLDAIRGLALQVAAETVAEQKALDNEVEEVRVDGAVGKAVDDMKKNLIVSFQGALDARKAMRMVEQSVANLPWQGGKGYYWVVIRGPQRLRQQVGGGAGPVYLARGDALAYVTDDNLPGIQNIFYKRGFQEFPNRNRSYDDDDPSNPWRNREPRRQGFVADLADSLRRSSAGIAPEFRVKAVPGRGTGRRLPPPPSPFTGKTRVAQTGWSFFLYRSIGSKRSRR